MSCLSFVCLASAILFLSSSSLARPEGGSTPLVAAVAQQARQAASRPATVKVANVCRWEWEEWRGCNHWCRSIGFVRGGCDDFEACYCWDQTAPLGVRHDPHHEDDDHHHHDDDDDRHHHHEDDRHHHEEDDRHDHHHEDDDRHHHEEDDRHDPHHDKNDDHHHHEDRLEATTAAGY